MLNKKNVGRALKGIAAGSLLGIGFLTSFIPAQYLTYVMLGGGLIIAYEVVTNKPFGK